jgi:hypothetical protein
MSSSLFGGTDALSWVSVSSVRPLDPLCGLDFVCLLDFGEQFSVCVGLKEVVLVEQFASGVGQLKEPVRLAPFEPLTIPFDGLDQSANILFPLLIFSHKAYYYIRVIYYK